MRTRYLAVAIDYDQGSIQPLDVEIAIDEKLANAVRVTVVGVGERTHERLLDQARSPGQVWWHADDTLVVEVEKAAGELGMKLNDAVSFIVGVGLGRVHEMGLVSGRATEPMDPAELFRRLAEAITLSDNPPAEEPT
jgi:hypothetical protein